MSVTYRVCSVRVPVVRPNQAHFIFPNTRRAACRHFVYSPYRQICGQWLTQLCVIQFAFQKWGDTKM